MSNNNKIKEISCSNEEGKRKCCYNLFRVARRNRIMSLHNEILKHLKLRQTKLKKADINMLLSDIPKKIYVAKFESIDGELVRRAPTKSRGKSGPSVVNGEGDSYSDRFQTFTKVAKKLSAAHKSVSLEVFFGLSTYNF